METLLTLKPLAFFYRIEYTILMDLQQTFYLMGIIFMVVHFIILTAIVVLLFYIRKKMVEIQEGAEEKFEIIKAVAMHPKELLASVGATMAESAIKKLGNIGKEKLKHKEEDE